MLEKTLLYLQSLRALLVARRLIPFICVVIALIATELLYRSSAAALLIDIGFCVIFWLVAPATWRTLCGNKPDLEQMRWIDRLRLAAYIVVCATTVLCVGGLLPLLCKVEWTYLTDVNSLGIMFVLFVVGGWGLGRDIELELGIERVKRKAHDLKQLAEHAQLLALRAHLDPHFLFNTLNAIAEWCREDPETAEAATLKLAQILRAILAGVRSQWWTLARELELLESLFELHRMRYPNRFTFTKRVPEPLPQVMVPPLLLLPLAENAMKHGPGKGHTGTVMLAVEQHDGELLVELQNPGSFDGPRLGGEGLSMVTKRLQLAYEDRARLHIMGQEANTLAQVTLPAPTQEKENTQ